MLKWKCYLSKGSADRTKILPAEGCTRIHTILFTSNPFISFRSFLAIKTSQARIPLKTFAPDAAAGTQLSSTVGHICENHEGFEAQHNPKQLWASYHDPTATNGQTAKGSDDGGE